MKDVFHCINTKYANNLTVVTIEVVTFGTNSISSLGPKLRNSLPTHLKYSK